MADKARWNRVRQVLDGLESQKPTTLLELAELYDSVTTLKEIMIEMGDYPQDIFDRAEQISNHRYQLGDK